MQSPSFFTNWEKLWLLFKLNWKHELKDIVTYVGWFYFMKEFGFSIEWILYGVGWTALCSFVGWIVIPEKRWTWKGLEKFRQKSFYFK